ncbi:hypothetical protein KU306_16650 (plasmid) [Haloferax larsenii]|uniref:DUF6788 domain-containing protein n=1 Tax=Haloferax larsenii TaxID=302484 RepID=A0ABY5RIE7_HALLR|nr:hypothetical protein [Haloferax larsenii]UVE51954.1 hypothetical protein KU306_16650 [Haloferax larsenii]
MSFEKPDPGQDIPTRIVEALDGLSSETLRHVAQYTEQLAEHRERKQRLREKQDSDRDAVDRPDDMPEDVPSKASLTVKEINDNRYYYWQWREGDQIKSKYKGPVDRSE